MRSSLMLAAASFLAFGVNANLSTSATKSSATSISAKISNANASRTILSSPEASNEPCARVGASAASFASASPSASSFPMVNPSDAMACLHSVPLDPERSLALIDFISPFLQHTSTLPYLKNPPPGWTLPGVDLFGGLSTIAANVQSGLYANQYAFERDLFTLVNVLPRDYHMNLYLPLIKNIFSFERTSELASVSLDGASLPQIYLLTDMYALVKPCSDWTASPVVSIDGQDPASYLLRLGLDTQAYLDADGIYNQIPFSIPSNATNSDSRNGAFSIGAGNVFGFSSDNTTYVFANGTTLHEANVAEVLVDLDGIDTGTALFNQFEIPSNSSDNSTSTSSSTPAPIVTSLQGYPTPIVMHNAGYTSGYFLANSSSIAVLAINMFEDINDSTNEDNDAIQQSVISTFLTACMHAGKTQLIVDVQGNGGGSLFNGVDAFKQLFPAIDPLGASRMRETPLVDYIGSAFSNSGVRTLNLSTVYQTQGSLDVNNQDFADYKAMIGPQQIYGDNFTALTRFNFTDPVYLDSSAILVSGYGNKSDIPASPFTAENIILLHDGGCGSTCATFAEMMKSQGGVRSIAVGGRPQYGPMQGVTGSKGAQVSMFDNLVYYVLNIPSLAPAYAKKGQVLPDMTVPDAYNVTLSDGSNAIAVDTQSSRFNLRNNFHSADASEVPLQFVYEAANCRLFYQPSDLIHISDLWQRVAKVAWGDGECVAGSSVNANNTLPKNAYDTVPFGPSAGTNVTMSFNPPGMINANGNGATGNGKGNAPGQFHSSAASRNINLALLSGVIGAVLMI